MYIYTYIYIYICSIIFISPAKYPNHSKHELQYTFALIFIGLDRADLDFLLGA